MFSNWMSEVNAHLSALCGMTAYDLPDQAYRDAFDDGWDAADYAADVMDRMLSGEF